MFKKLRQLNERTSELLLWKAEAGAGFEGAAEMRTYVKGRQADLLARFGPVHIFPDEIVKVT